VQITVAVTGASGAIYPHRLLNHLVKEEEVSKVYLVASSAGTRVLKEELHLNSVSPASLVEALLQSGREKIEVLNNHDIGAKIASGSFPVDAMVVLPCTMGTLGAIASGTSRDLIQRAADVMLKERRKLLLVVRDTPFNLIHIENMRTLTLAGAVIFPAIPSFYYHPASIEEVIDQFLYRVMLQLGLKPPGAYRWMGSSVERVQAGDVK
jgi:4-hydroxy-3-polyprenylbenzoate decarboxylase